jgi:hypothetical protein
MKKTISTFDLSHILGLDITTLEDMLDGNSLHTEDEIYSLDLPADGKQRLDVYFDNQPKAIGKQRKDLQGFFYDLQPKTVTVKPEPTWERDDYLPDLEYCLNYQYDEFTDRELVDCCEKLAYDIEIFGNYCLIAFKGIISGKQCFIELSANHTPNYRKLSYLMDNKEFVSFNGIKFDLPIMTLFLAGKTTTELWRATEMLIVEEQRPYEVLRHFGVEKREIDQIDIMNVAKGMASLKLYAARLGLHNIQDLPFKPGINLNANQIAIVKRYCLNDLDATLCLYNYLQKPIEIRIDMGNMCKVDLRSKGGAQCAEIFIKSEVEKETGVRIPKSANLIIDSVKYVPAPFIKFNRPDLNEVLNKLENEIFYITNGKTKSELLKNTVVNIGGNLVQMGSGGLHSKEHAKSYYSDEDFVIWDIDVGSLYPTIMILLEMYPPKIGKVFTKVFKSIRVRRFEAKLAKNKKEDAVFKEVLVSTFGKLGECYGDLYAPSELVRTTVTGQLALLMIAERIEALGITICSFNTDGTTLHLKRSLFEKLQHEVSQWEKETGLEMEYVEYKSIHIRDVNNYFAVKAEGGVKRKGAYAEFEIDKNTPNIVCSEAVARWLEFSESMEDYVLKCDDVKKFLTPRKVDGGACKNGEFIGKTIRWYHSNSTNTPIVYAKNGNKVPDSDNCRPMQRLTDTIPSDLDYQWYYDNCYRILRDVGVKL